MECPPRPAEAMASAVLATLARCRSALRLHGVDSDFGRRVLRDSVHRLQELLHGRLEVHLGGAEAIADGTPLPLPPEVTELVHGLTRLGVVGLVIEHGAQAGELLALLTTLAAPPSRDIDLDTVSRLRQQDLHAIRFLLAGDLSEGDAARVAQAHSDWLATLDGTPAHHALDVDAGHLRPVVRELRANLPVLVAGQILDDLAARNLSPGVALTTLVDLLDEMLTCGDAAAVAWLLDEGPHGGPGGEGYRFLTPHVDDSLSTLWFEGFFSTAPPEQIQALVPLLAHLPAGVINRCLQARGLRSHPDVRTLLVAMAALAPNALTAHLATADGAWAAALEDALRWSGQARHTARPRPSAPK